LFILSNNQLLHPSIIRPSMANVQNSRLMYETMILNVECLFYPTTMDNVHLSRVSDFSRNIYIIHIYKWMLVCISIINFQKLLDRFQQKLFQCIPWELVHVYILFCQPLYVGIGYRSHANFYNYKTIGHILLLYCY